jgi:putative phosphoesterase
MMSGFTQSISALAACYVGAMATFGIISDTHGLLRPEARAALVSVDRIIHAGDIDDPSTLQWLNTIAPVIAVRGNCDRGGWARALPDHQLLTVEGYVIYVVHDLGCITVDPKTDGIKVVVCGHTHSPRNETCDGVLYFNPGSAGPCRYGKPVSLGKLHIGPERIESEIVMLAGEKR